ncbi:hypothetical protein ACIQXM_00465 [Arthrobacter sp. NPDC097144]|uniref:hypothetical protein n=1 Tax=Arthrobacter sp. NPDC097144 TaxID=3363946 RepID=UPI00380E18E2
MNNTMKTGALCLAGILALSACSSGESASSASPASQASSASAPASSAPSFTPAPAAGREQYTADELEAALTAVKAGQGLNGEVRNDAAVRPLLAENPFTGVTIAPEQCRSLMSSFLDEKISAGNLAAVGLEGSDMLMLISYDNASAPNQQTEGSRQLIKDCGNFTAELGGTAIDGSVETIDASTQAPSTQAFRTELSRDGKPLGTVIQVSAVSGTVNAGVTLFDPEDEDAAVAAAETTINAALAELEKN